jgi:hypothetical protein
MAYRENDDMCLFYLPYFVTMNNLLISNAVMNQKIQSQLEYMRMSLFYGIMKMTANRGDRPSFMKDIRG